MLATVLVIALAQSQGDRTRAFEETTKVGRNDLKAPVEGPDSVHVAMCDGTDSTGASVFLLDRLCLNRASVEVVSSAIDRMEADRNRLLNKLNETNKALSESRAKEGVDPVIVTVIAIGAACLTAGAIVGGMKAAGKL